MREVDIQSGSAGAGNSLECAEFISVIVPILIAADRRSRGFRPLRYLSLVETKGSGRNKGVGNHFRREKGCLAVSFHSPGRLFFRLVDYHSPSLHGATMGFPHFPHAILEAGRSLAGSVSAAGLFCSRPRTRCIFSLVWYESSPSSGVNHGILQSNIETFPARAGGLTRLITRWSS